MAVFLVQRLVGYIPLKVSRVQSFAALRNSIDNRLLLSTKASLDEILDPSVSREEICFGYIRELCAAGNLAAAARLPQALSSKHIFLGPRVYNYLLEDADRENDIDKVSQVFKGLLISRGSVRLESYLIVARAFGKQNNPAVLLKFIKDICEMEIPRVDMVLNRVIFAFSKCGHVDSALLVFDHMRSSKLKPDLVTYNTVVAILGRLGKVDDMLHIFNSMKEVDISPDIVTYNTVLNSLRKMGRLDLCLMHFKEMFEKGIRPDLLTFKALIESLGRSGNISHALKIFDEMKSMGIRPSIHIYRAMIFSLKKMGKMELASRFSTEMNKLLGDSDVSSSVLYKNR